MVHTRLGDSRSRWSGRRRLGRIELVLIGAWLAVDFSFVPTCQRTRDGCAMYGHLRSPSGPKARWREADLTMGAHAPQNDRHAAVSFRAMTFARESNASSPSFAGYLRLASEDAAGRKV